jgi:hypothetical protein
MALALGVQRIRGDQHAAEVAGLAEQRGEHGDLVRLRAHLHLAQDHAGAVIEASQQVRRRAVAGAGAAHGLAVHRQHHLPARPLGGKPRAHPCPDCAVQRRRVHRGQHPPDRHQVRDGPAKPQPGAQPRRGVSGPLGDRRVRPRSRQHRAHRNGQHRHQPIPAPARVPRVRDLPKRFQQPLRRGGSNRQTMAAEQGKLATGQHGRRR